MHRGTPEPILHEGLPHRAGVALKPDHFPEIVDAWPDIGFFEIHAENYLVDGGPFHHYLSAIRERYPLSIHGVGLSIGAEHGLSHTHLHAVKALVERYEPAVFSEHLAWSTHDNVFLNDLLPLPYTRDVLERVCQHIEEVQEVLGRQMLLENPSTYVEFERSEYSEMDFIREIARRTGCGLLLDVNNVYVSCTNHGWDALSYLSEFPVEAVKELHLAGFAREEDTLGAPLLIDSHDRQVDQAVWDLFSHVIAQAGPKPTLIEWDSDLPTLDILNSEARRAETYLQRLPSSSSEVVR